MWYKQKIYITNSSVAADCNWETRNVSRETNETFAVGYIENGVTYAIIITNFIRPMSPAGG